MLGYEETKLPTGWQGTVLFRNLSDLSCPLGGPYAEHKEDKRWLNNQHLAMWCGHSFTQRQAQKLISGPSPTSSSYTALQPI
jgi:hypothetical protein